MDHEDLDVYNAALDFVSFVQDAIQRMPGGRRGLDDQLMRAATSMPLNIAEGAGEFSAKQGQGEILSHRPAVSDGERRGS